MTTESTKPLVLAAATDRNYLPWAATALLSAVRSTAGDVSSLEVCLLHQGLADGDLDLLATSLEAAGAGLRALPIDSGAMGRLPSGAAAHGGDVGCARFLLPQLLPDVKRVLYIDADTFVRSSVAPLFAIDMLDRPVAAAINVVLPQHAERIRGLGLDPKSYFNSGVLLMDLDAWRRTGATEQLLDVLDSHGERLQWVDQDALNLVFRDGWLPVPIRWNCQNSLFNWRDVAIEQLGEAEVTAAVTDPAIVHFEGGGWAKPWHYLSPHPLTAAYRAEAAAGPYGPPRLVCRTLTNRVLARAGGLWWAIGVHDRLVASGLHRCSP
ncbi:MAG TPA: glycosyltransferase family 8 protein [Mycobacteriales bacterium]|nr:glycosyltransferase family 8 protein [Mycobacteriales bacterium]